MNDEQALCMCGHGYQSHYAPIGRETAGPFTACRCGLCPRWTLWDRTALRDEFAMTALPGVIARIPWGELTRGVQTDAAAQVYEIADAMLKARTLQAKKEEPKP